MILINEFTFPWFSRQLGLDGSHFDWYGSLRSFLLPAGGSSMDVQFWINLGWLGLILVHVITPFIPFAWFIRAGVTIAMATRYDWLTVALVANTASMAGLVAQYFFFSWLNAAKLIEQIERFEPAKKIFAGLQSRLFLKLVILNASPIPETLLPLVASAKKYPVTKFAAAMFIGRLSHTIPMALGGVGGKWLWQLLH